MIEHGSRRSLRLLAVLAHPDDESLGVGGTLAKYAADGIEVFLLTATRGDAGRFRGHRPGSPEHPGAEALGAIRETELRTAAAALGVSKGAVSQWVARGKAGGVAALRNQPHSGATPKLAEQQRQRLPDILRRGAQAYGFVGDVWTQQLIAAVIKREGNTTEQRGAGDLYRTVMRQMAPH